MMNEGKYKRWAWGALIGLAGVIVVACIIMVVTISTPKPSTKDNTATTVATQQPEQNTAEKKTTEKKSEEKKDEKTTKKSGTNDKTASNDKKTETKPKAATSNPKTTSSQKQSNSGSVNSSNANIPKTGPEEAIVPVVAIAICGYLFAYNVALFKKNA